MLRTKFRYNPENLRYERVKISFFNVLITVLSYCSFGVLFFAALLLLQNYVIETPEEKHLRTENSALQQHKIILTGQLEQADYQLEELKKQDQELYEKLFETNQPVDENQSLKKREEILIAEAGDFNEIINDLDNRFNDLYKSAKISNQFFHAEASVKKEDLSSLFTIPSIIPIENFDLSKLVSGFGTRINPFHKGHYHHDGVDIASPRGTSVLSAGHGRVIMTKRSDLLAGFGNYIEIDHGHGVISRYSHLEDIHVHIGQKIKKGQVIGNVGSSGGSIAPHLHYEVILDEVNIDPIKFFAEGIDAGEFKELAIKSKTQNQSLD
jgi:murein DD-endopeptidase MepM/ murein hydrolase activator NlpD